MNKFWMVLGRDVPRVQHATELKARTEAVRLARLHPGESFTVLESLTTVKMNDLTWEDHINDDEIPF